MLQVGKSASFTEFWMVKQKETVCGRVRVSEKREGSGEMFGLGCNPRAASWTKHTVHFCAHSNTAWYVGGRRALETVSPNAFILLMRNRDLVRVAKITWWLRRRVLPRTFPR